MPCVTRRPAAERDLIAIYQHIAADSPVAAAAFLRRLDGKIRMLAGMPAMGSQRLTAYPSVRLFPVGSYLILYQPLPSADGIELIRVFHAARDWLPLIEGELG